MNVQHEEPVRSFRAALRWQMLGRLALCWGLTLCMADLANAQEQKPEKGWVSLFNGKDLEGWTPKITKSKVGENFGNTFRVEDGVLKVAYDQYKAFDGRFGHLFHAKKFSNYRLRIEYRFVGEQCPGGPGWAIRNSGVMLHCQSPESMSVDQDFPVSVEVQFLGGDGKKERSTCNVCTPGTHIVMDGELITRHCTNSRSKTYAGDQWVTAEVEVHGDEIIKHMVNGEVVLSYEKTQYDERDPTAKPLIADGNLRLREGYISLQSESHPIEFRKVEILELEPSVKP